MVTGSISIRGYLNNYCYVHIKIKSLLGKINMDVYILYGNDKFNIQRRVEQIKKVIDNEWLQFNYCSMPNDANPFSVINEVLTQGFGRGKKIIISSNDCLFKDKESAKKAIIEKLELAPINNILLITTTKKPSLNTTVVKELLKYGNLEEFKLIDQWKTSEIAEYIKSEAITYELNFTDDCVDYLVSNIGNDTQLINSELKKIAAYATNGNISIETLKLLVKNNYANSIELAKHCLSGETKLAIEKLNQLGSEHPLQIVATLLSCFRTWLAVKAGVIEEKSNSEITKIGCIYNPKRIYFLKKEVSACSIKRLQSILSILTHLEFELKTGQNTLTSNIIQICELR